jgi:hypothetical protein
LDVAISSSDKTVGGEVIVNSGSHQILQWLCNDVISSDLGFQMNSPISQKFIVPEIHEPTCVVGLNVSDGRLPEAQDIVREYECY